MNTMSIDFQSFIEFDSNPFILFNNSGKLIYLNSSAEILLGHVSQKELFNLALSYAPHNFGFKNTNIDLQYDVFEFHAIMVGYENEEELAIRFYNKPIISTVKTVEDNNLIFTNINILLEANIGIFKNTYKNTKLTLLTDQDIPEFKVDQNSLSKLIRDILDSINESSFIDISLKMIIGSHIIINNQKSSLVELSFKHNTTTGIPKQLKELAQNNNMKLIEKDFHTKVEIPVIM